MSLYALTCYYNPLHGDLRLRNYQTFRRHLGIPLIAVEWSAHGHFELREEDADHLIQVSGGDLLWQKERLLNIGLEKARELDVDKIAVLDADIVFENPSWYEAVTQGLEKNVFVQCFQSIRYLRAYDYTTLSHQALCDSPVEHAIEGLFKFLEKGQSLYDEASRGLLSVAAVKLRGNPGLGTAINLKKVPDWRHYEGNIVGGGDLAMVAAINHQTDELFDMVPHTPEQQRHLLSWAQAVNVDSISIGSVKEQVMHLWHGEIKDRQYRQRFSVLTQHGYDPVVHVDFEIPGALHFTPKGKTLQQAVEAYIRSRKDA